MPELWKALLAMVLATLASLGGTITLRLASEDSNLALAIVGGSLWSLSGAGFVYASSKGMELGVLSAAMSAVGILAINAIGMIYWGDIASPRKFIALGLLVLAIALLAWPTPKA